MNLRYVENLARESKQGDYLSKQELSKEFKPFIINLSMKYKIQGYDFDDLMGECYKALFTSLEKYNTEKQRFVAFGTISIKNHLKTLLRDTLRKNKAQNVSINSLENLLFHDDDLEEKLCDEDFKLFMKKCFKNLKDEEQEFLKFVYFQKKSVRAFAIKNNMKYSQASTKNKIILQKLKAFMKVS